MYLEKFVLNIGLGLILNRVLRMELKFYSLKLPALIYCICFSCVIGTGWMSVSCLKKPWRFKTITSLIFI